MDNNLNLFSVINPLDLTCQSVKPEVIQDVVLLPYSSLTINNSDKIPFKIDNSGQLILAHLNYGNFFQSKDINQKKINEDSNLLDYENELLNKKLKDIKCESHKESDMTSNLESVNDCITFLKCFKDKRKYWKLYQSQITNSLTHYKKFPKLSQSYLSRLEKLDVTYKSARNVISYLKVWLKNAEELFKIYIKNFSNESDFLSLDSENLSKFHDFILNHSQSKSINSDIKCSNQVLERRKRTVFSKPVLQKLTSLFDINQFPKSQDIQSIAINYKVNQESIMQWFSNQRRKFNKV